MVKHYTRKGTQSILEVNENRIILSNPDIQAINEFKYEGPQDILYFYYDTKIQFNTNYFYTDWMTEQEKEERDKEDEITRQPNWVTLIKDRVTEFSSILDLVEVIKVLKEIDPDQKMQKQYFYDRDGKQDPDHYRTSFELSAVGFIEEEAYVLKKYHEHYITYDDEKDKDIEVDRYWYSVYFGIGNENKENTVGFLADRLTNEDLDEIVAWVDDFMELAKQITHKKIESWYRSNEDQYYCDPAWFREHMKEKYPEDFENWKEIWADLYDYTPVLEEYFNYVKEREIKQPFRNEKDQYETILDEIKAGEKDWKAYLDYVKMIKRLKKYR